MPKNCRPANHEILSKPWRTDACVYTVETVEGVITETASNCFNVAFMTTYTILCYSNVYDIVNGSNCTLMTSRSRAKTILWTLLSS